MPEGTGMVPLLLLGSYHMDNPGRDAFNAQVDDARSPQRQEEIAAVVRGLRAFRPTKVALEVRTELDGALNTDYAAYRAGAYALPSNERQQIGFRLAAELGHERVYAIDWNEANRDVDVFGYAEAHQPDIYTELVSEGQRFTEEVHEHLAHAGVGDVLRWLNSPEELARNHRIYLTMAGVGAGKNYVGIDWLTGWWERNLKIYVNLTRITEPGDRILVLYGTGHIPLLTQFTRDSGMYALEVAACYLP